MEVDPRGGYPPLSTSSEYLNADNAQTGDWQTRPAASLTATRRRRARTG